MTASVSSSAIQQAEKICQAAITELNSSAQKLNTRYREAGQRWRDDKYKQLGAIIDDCTKSMKKPVDELSDCVEKLRAIGKVLAEIESANIK